MVGHEKAFILDVAIKSKNITYYSLKHSQITERRYDERQKTSITWVDQILGNLFGNIAAPSVRSRAADPFFPFSCK